MERYPSKVYFPHPMLKYIEVEVLEVIQPRKDPQNSASESCRFPELQEGRDLESDCKPSHSTSRMCPFDPPSECALPSPLRPPFPPSLAAFLAALLARPPRLRSSPRSQGVRFTSDDGTSRSQSPELRPALAKQSAK